ncbi:ribosome biogenesis GTP-binding protein YihA/YsxC [Candidatus Liberibacter asiaticus]|uniref:Probable GTP-binding protein EngB n=2 Tax=Liberibacter asiaticus TaxID=34021 RepID=C6XF05_LIBAP|nr:ribosome biogenesis GTP-binding protein YihA/YsxC [Candidatus Liberibacter asiaticus]ACT56957.1 GTPase EngB [Candidatus Liberibacter asiaticus str. psy62]AGH16721.1 GTPase EngB [Candidatus Liberibacter asiaticus str. gxpsy]ALK07096.1 YihA family ribosome biogenesis GTP-binding protein [Candidatus Liberibacter asiaticus]ASK52570.1 YihA family ribosome biogenesis GTP-binding protein [Candidatus Liberibacter asiaticus]AWL13896.1 YihA family ribosome biogenesis GTP-binding protein [Candidatus L
MVSHTIFTKSAWIFLRGVPEIGLLPKAGPPEIAFSGRSNVGKSSLINILVNRKNLARTSNAPGRTQHLNFFVPKDFSNLKNNLPAMALVDMPGYGYARAPKKNVDSWGGLIVRYLSERSTLRCVYLLIDCRHGVKQIDQDVFSFLDKKAVSYQIVLTKIDKLSPTTAQETLEKTKYLIRNYPTAHPEVIPTSSVKRKGIEVLRKAILETINY